METEQLLPKKKNTDSRRKYSLFLLLNTVITGFYTILSLQSFVSVLNTGKYSDIVVQIQFYALMIIFILTFISTIGMWRWRRWGRIGSLVGFSVLGLIFFAVGLIFLGCFHLIWIGVVYFVTRRVKMHFK
jgi:hypothetical protein